MDNLEYNKHTFRVKLLPRTNKYGSILTENGFKKSMPGPVRNRMEDDDHLISYDISANDFIKRTTSIHNTFGFGESLHKLQELLPGLRVANALTRSPSFGEMLIGYAEITYKEDLYMPIYEPIKTIK